MTGSSDGLNLRGGQPRVIAEIGGLFASCLSLILELIYLYVKRQVQLEYTTR